MWRRSFVATTVALGDGVDAARAALGVEPDARTTDLMREASSPSKATRTVALAKVLREVALAIDEATLR